MSLLEFCTNELSGWKKWEALWLAAACGIITGLSLFWHDSVMGIISATTGLACVVCTGKGKLSAYLFGLINVVLYAIISYRARYYRARTGYVRYYYRMPGSQAAPYARQLVYDAMSLLAKDGSLPAEYKPHLLKGDRKGQWECHIEPNWLMTWEQNNNELTLLFLQTGTHADIFGW